MPPGVTPPSHLPAAARSGRFRVPGPGGGPAGAPDAGPPAAPGPACWRREARPPGRRRTKPQASPGLSADAGRSRRPALDQAAGRPGLSAGAGPSRRPALDQAAGQRRTEPQAGPACRPAPDQAAGQRRLAWAGLARFHTLPRPGLADTGPISILMSSYLRTTYPMIYLDVKVFVLGMPPPRSARRPAPRPRPGDRPWTGFRTGLPGIGRNLARLRAGRYPDGGEHPFGPAVES
jgi:hypothetical protein